MAVSISVKWRLKEAGLQNYMEKKKQLISKKSKANRLVFEKKYTSTSLELWLTIILSDDSMFELLGLRGKKYEGGPIMVYKNDFYIILLNEEVSR